MSIFQNPFQLNNEINALQAALVYKFQENENVYKCNRNRS